MAVNRGKQFEDVIYDAFNKVPGVSIDRIHDQTTGYKGSSNICDFIVYSQPKLIYLECKSCHGNTISIHSNNPKNMYGAISNKQWEGLTKKSIIPGVVAGILVWFVDKDITVFFTIDYLNYAKSVKQFKSVRFDDAENGIILSGTKKRIFFDYDVKSFLEEVMNFV